MAINTRRNQQTGWRPGKPRRAQQAIRHVRALIVGVGLVLVAGGLAPTPAAATPQLSCYSRLPSAPHNSYICPIPSSYYNQEVYLQAFPKQRESDCGSRSTEAQIHVQVAVVRYNTSFRITGLWIVYERGLKRYAFFQVNAVDATNTARNGSWNYDADWHDDDVAERGTNDITRWPASRSSFPTLLWDGGAGVPRLQIWVSERDVPHFTGWGGGCTVGPFYVNIARAA